MSEDHKNIIKYEKTFLFATSEHCIFTETESTSERCITEIWSAANPIDYSIDYSIDYHDYNNHNNDYN